MTPPIDIDSPKGTKVVFWSSIPEQVRWGGNDDPDEHLVRGQTYTIERTEIHSQHTKVFLEGFPGLKFNSVSFVKP